MMGRLYFRVGLMTKSLPLTLNITVLIKIVTTLPYVTRLLTEFAAIALRVTVPMSSLLTLLIFKVKIYFQKKVH